MKIKTLADLKPDGRNARKHNPRNIGMITSSLGKVGAARSIVIDEDGNILAGNGTVEALAEVGIEKVRVVETNGDEIVAVQRKGLSPEQKIELALADNRSAELAEWDPGVLEELNLETPDVLDGMFFTEELDDIFRLNDAEMGPVDGEDDVPEPLADTISKQGDIWILGDHRLMCGDSTNETTVADLMDGQKADMVFTDPPYGIGQAGVTNDEPEKLDGIISGAVNCLPIDNGIIVAFQSTRTFPVWLDAIRVAGQQFERILTMYKKAQCTFPWRGWILKSESILLSTIGEPKWNEVKPYSHDCYELPQVSNELPEGAGWHGSVKPQVVLTDILSRCSVENSKIHDPFGGSGSTLIACEKLKRKCYMMEIDPAYCDVIIKRWEKFTGQKAELS